MKTTFTLYNQVKIPNVGFGTWQITEGAYESVKYALKTGYRHIDTAEAYGNEKEVGKAVKDSRIARSDIFLTTKLPSHIKTYDETIKHFHESLERLDMEYIDLYLIHAPWPWSDQGSDHTAGNIEAWKAMIHLYEKGLIRSIGVSNFGIKDIEALIRATNFIPHVNQIPLFISVPQNELRAYCTSKNILVEAYSPLATGKLLKVDAIVKMAEKYQVTPAQLCIKFCLDLGTLPLPKSTHEERIRNNFDLNFKISESDFNDLLGLKDVFKTHLNERITN